MARGTSRLAIACICLAIASTMLAGPLYAQTKPDALSMYKQGRYDDARAACLAEIAADQTNIESYVVLVWSLLALQRYADAEMYANRAYTTIRKDPRIVEVLGEASYYQGKNDDALARFRDYINLLPDGSRIGTVYYLMGETYLRQARYSHADISIRTALQYEPQNARWWTRLGYVRERASDWSWSMQAYDAAIAINPGLTDAVLGKQRVAARLGP